MRKIISIILLAFLGLSLNLNAQTDDVINKDSIREAKLLALPEIRNAAKRIGNKLFLSFDDGTSDTLISEIEIDKEGRIDENENGIKDTVYINGTINYWLNEITYNKQYFFITKHTYPMGGGMDLYYFLLVNKSNGFSLEVDSEPIFSSDNTKFITYHGWEPADGNILGITITSVSKNKYFKEFYLVDKNNNGYDDVRWVTNNEIKITRSNSETGKTLPPLIYKFNGTKWVLATAQPAKKPAPAVKKPIKK